MRLPCRKAECCRCMTNPKPHGDLPAQSVGVGIREEKGTAKVHSWDVPGNASRDEHGQHRAGAGQRSTPKVSFALLGAHARATGALRLSGPALNLFRNRLVLYRGEVVFPLKAL